MASTSKDPERLFFFFFPYWLSWSTTINQSIENTNFFFLKIPTLFLITKKKKKNNYTSKKKKKKTQIKSAPKGSFETIGTKAS